MPHTQHWSPARDAHPPATVVLTEQSLKHRVEDAFKNGRLRGLHEALAIVRESNFGRFEVARLEQHICKIMYGKDTDA